jgi:hypothetical protein
VSPSGNATCEHGEQSALRTNKREEERDKFWRGRSFKSLLREYGDKKKRPSNQQDNRRSEDRIEGCSKKSTQLVHGTHRRRRLQRAPRHAAAHRCTQIRETSIQKTAELSRSFCDTPGYMAAMVRDRF